jgi:hypothetical protein
VPFCSHILHSLLVFIDKGQQTAFTAACLGVLNTFNVFIFRENDKYAAFNKQNTAIFAFYKQQL